jgi:hypothetical protein
MTSRRQFVAGMGGLLVMGLHGRRHTALAQTPITIYKSSSCGCCAKWVDYLRVRGFQPRVHDEEEMDRLKDRMGVPSDVRSCHTAILGSYLIEGHVPVEDIQRLLEERPRIAGLAVPGMPQGSPGMAPPGMKEGGYEVVAFQFDGSTSRFAAH